jgi:hypothetical protein
MMTNTTKRTLNRARAEGIELTPRGEPLFARDLKRFAEIVREEQERDVRTEAEKLEDAMSDG